MIIYDYIIGIYLFIREDKNKIKYFECYNIFD